MPQPHTDPELAVLKFRLLRWSRRMPWLVAGVFIGVATYVILEKTRQPALSEALIPPWKNVMRDPVQVAISPSGRFLVARSQDDRWIDAGRKDPGIFVWNLANGKNWS